MLLLDPGLVSLNEARWRHWLAAQITPPPPRSAGDQEPVDRHTLGLCALH